MNTENIVITIFAEDRPGIVREISDTVLANGGSWQESSLSRLSGQFAGIVNIAVAPDQREALQTALSGLSDSGISVTSQNRIEVLASRGSETTVELMVEANDRQGIIEEIASALAAAEVNVEQMETICESASMAGYELFIAHLMVALPEGMNTQQLEDVLEDVSDDLMVSILA